MKLVFQTKFFFFVLKERKKKTCDDSIVFCLWFSRKKERKKTELKNLFFFFLSNKQQQKIFVCITRTTCSTHSTLNTESLCVDGTLYFHSLRVGFLFIFFSFYSESLGALLFPVIIFLYFYNFKSIPSSSKKKNSLRSSQLHLTNKTKKKHLSQNDRCHIYIDFFIPTGRNLLCDL